MKFAMQILVCFSTLASSSTIQAASSVPHARIEPGIEACGEQLMASAGRKSDASRDLIRLYTRASVHRDVEFMQYVLSIIYVESGFNRGAVSEKNARGLMQMTSIAVEEAVGSCSSLPHLGDMDSLHDSYTNVKYGTCYLYKLYRDMDRDWTRTLVVYNGGYRQLSKYDKGESIATETANYVLKVTRARNRICLSEGGNL